MSAAALCEALEFLLQLKAHKEVCGKDEFYRVHQPLAWTEARQAVENYKRSKGRE